MSDPNFTDPRNKPRQWDEPYDPSAIGPWGWVAGIVVVAAIAIILVSPTRARCKTPPAIRSPRPA